MRFVFNAFTVRFIPNENTQKPLNSKAIVRSNSTLSITLQGKHINIYTNIIILQLKTNKADISSSDIIHRIFTQENRV